MQPFWNIVGWWQAHTSVDVLFSILRWLSRYSLFWRTKPEPIFVYTIWEREREMWMPFDTNNTYIKQKTMHSVCAPPTKLECTAPSDANIATQNALSTHARSTNVNDNNFHFFFAKHNHLWFTTICVLFALFFFFLHLKHTERLKIKMIVTYLSFSLYECKIMKILSLLRTNPRRSVSSVVFSFSLLMWIKC